VSAVDADRPSVDYRVARIWRGVVAADRADAYEAYLLDAGVRVLSQTALGVEQLREDRGDVVEFVTISYWESVDAMARYTGGPPTAIHHLDRDAELLVGLPDRVQVLQVVARHWPGPPSGT
jgi:hypothetical protein